MNINEKTMLQDFIREFKDKEDKRKDLRNRIVKSLDRIEHELYDDKDSSNEGLLTRVNNLDEAVKEIANLVKRTKIRNEVILSIIAAIMIAIMSNLLNHYIKVF